MNIALYPGSFSPGHIGHFDVVQKLCSEMDKVYIIKSNKPRDGISAEQSLNVWNLYLQLLPENVEIKLSGDLSPITECFHIIKNDPDNDYYIVYGKKEVDHVKSFEKLKWKNVHIYNAGNYGNISATKFRQAIRDRNIEQIKSFLPPGVSDVEFMEKMGLNLHEIKIVPNQRYPKVGDVYNLNGIEYKITKIENDNLFTFSDVKDRGINIIPKFLLDDLIKNKKAKYIRHENINEQLFSKDWWNKQLIQEDIEEIKIVPNILQPKVGQVYYFDKEAIFAPGEYIIEEIIGDPVFYIAIKKVNEGVRFNITPDDWKDYVKNKELRYIRTENKLQERQEQITKLIDEQKTTIKQFIGYAFKELNITTPLNGLKLSYDNNAVKQRASFAYYDPNDNKIWVYVKNRNMADILRSIAHELVHSKQNEEGRIQANSGETGTDIENEANSRAGIMLRNFGKDNKGIYEIKIIPNQRKLKVGDIVIPSKFDENEPPHYVDLMDDYIGQKSRITNIEIDSYDDEEGNPKEYTFYTLENSFNWPRSALKFVSVGKNLDEIKIVPQIKFPKIGDIVIKKLFDDEEDWDAVLKYKIINVGKDYITLSKITDNKISDKEYTIFKEQYRKWYNDKVIKIDNSNIEEIKITPNRRQIQVGDVYEFDIHGNIKPTPEYPNQVKWDYIGQYKITDQELTNENDPSEGYWYHFVPVGNNGDDIPSMLYFSDKEVAENIKDKTIKYLRHENIDEIKIQPNIRIKLGDIFVPKNYKEDQEYVKTEVIEIDYKNDRIKIQFSVQYNNQPNTGITSTSEITITAFERWMEEKNYVKLPKNNLQEVINSFQQGIEEIVGEIKIVPLYKPQLGDIIEFLGDTSDVFEGRYRIIGIDNQIHLKGSDEENKYDYPKIYTYRFKNYINKGKIRLIKNDKNIQEIKIVPNTLYHFKVGDQWTRINNDGDQVILTILYVNNNEIRYKVWIDSYDQISPGFYTKSLNDFTDIIKEYKFKKYDKNI